MSLKIELGLFNLDFKDFHAILGVPVDADPKDIRRQYLKIARRLHPDSCVKESEADRQRAAEYLSKLVNPAYEKISNEKNYSEHCVLLKLKGQQALRQQETVMLVSDSARRLASATGDIEQPYRAALRDLAEKQYEHLDRTLELTGHISELNLVYLMRQEKKGGSTPISTANASASNANKAGGGTPPASPGEEQSRPPARGELIERVLKRVDEFEKKQDYPRAIMELREAIQQIDPNSSACHSRLGAIYLKSNQATMAKIHFKKALSIDPKDAIALDALRKLDPEAVRQAKPDDKSAAAKKSAAKPSKPDQSSGGLFGLFGGKKK